MKLIHSETRDPARLAELLKERNLPGQRSKTAIARLRRERFRRSAETPVVRSVHQRLADRLVARYAAEIVRRGGEVTIDYKKDGCDLRIADRAGRLALLRMEGWRRYSGGPRRVAVAYLCGMDDAGPWAVRVPAAIRYVDHAEDWLKPAEVIRAEEDGRRVLRQGDVYAVETTPARDGRAVPVGRHTWDADAGALVHPEHQPLPVPFPARLVPQRVLAMGRAGGRQAGD